LLRGVEFPCRPISACGPGGWRHGPKPGININRGGLLPDGKEPPALYPDASVTGYFSGGQESDQPRLRRTYQIKEDLSYSNQRHVLKFGGQYVKTVGLRTQDAAVDGVFTFNGQYTGNAFADFLLGKSNTMTQGQRAREQRAHPLHVALCAGRLAASSEAHTIGGVALGPFLRVLGFGPAPAGVPSRPTIGLVSERPVGLAVRRRPGRSARRASHPVEQLCAALSSCLEP